MSLILEALKKSEAKRRLGEAPDLGTPFATSRRRRSGLPLILIALAAAGAGTWWLLQRPAPTATANIAAAKSAPVNSPNPVTTTPAASAPPAQSPAPRPTASHPPQTAAPMAVLEAAPVAPPTVPGAMRHAASAEVAADQRAQSDARNKARVGAGKKLPTNMHRVEKSPPPDATAPKPAVDKVKVAEQTAPKKAPPAPGCVPRRESATATETSRRRSR